MRTKPLTYTYACMFYGTEDPHPTNATSVARAVHISLHLCCRLCVCVFMFRYNKYTEICCMGSNFASWRRDWRCFAA